MEHPKKNDGMDEWFTPTQDALIFFGAVIGTAVLLLFAGAMWALKPRLIYFTIGSVLILSLTVIWAVSTANGM